MLWPKPLAKIMAGANNRPVSLSLWHFPLASFVQLSLTFCTAIAAVTCIWWLPLHSHVALAKILPNCGFCRGRKLFRLPPAPVYDCLYIFQLALDCFKCSLSAGLTLIFRVFVVSLLCVDAFHGQFGKNYKQVFPFSIKYFYEVIFIRFFMAQI